jgi:hypothetical protein
VTGPPRSVLSGHNSSCCQIQGLRFRESGCAVLFPQGQSWKLLSEQRYRRHHQHSAKLADVMAAGNLTGGTLHVASIELKSGKVVVDDVREQLQNAADVLDRELPSRPAYRLSFVAVLVHGPIQSITIRKLRRCRVRFRGVPYSIDLKRCGAELGRQTWNPLAESR